MKKQTLLSAALAILLLTASLAPAFAPAGFALDVPRGQTEVRIPAAIAVNGPIAGAEIGFTHAGDGLTFTGLEPSASLAGAQRIKAERDGVVWVGFFSDENIYGPSAGGRLDMGYLVFAYTGDAVNTVTLTACTVYTVDASGKSVRDTRGAGGTVTIERPAATEENRDEGKGPGADDETGKGVGTGGGSAASGGFVINLGEDDTPLATTDDTPGSITFSDLSQAEWAREAIEYMANRKGILGMGNGLFAPNAEVTRAQFARFTAMALDIEKGTAPAAFTDVAEDAWYCADITTLASSGILTGYGDGRFGPNDKITREQTAVIIDRALTAKGIALASARAFDLTDRDAAADYAKASIERLYGAGVIDGMGDGGFAPKAPATRAQVCAILYKTLKAAGRA
jgi:hypothetical protein